MNMNKFKKIELEMTLLTPPVDPNYQSLTICDENGDVIGVTKDEPIYLYNYDMHLFEERYNILRFISVLDTICSIICCAVILYFW